VFNTNPFSIGIKKAWAAAYQRSLLLAFICTKPFNEALTWLEFCFFTSAMSPNVLRSRFVLTWLCDDHNEIRQLRREKSSASSYDSPLSTSSAEYGFKNRQNSEHLTSWPVLRGWERLVGFADSGCWCFNSLRLMEFKKRRVKFLRLLTGEKAGIGSFFLTFFLWSYQPRENQKKTMSHLG
jgi:hypothetical protein